MVENLSGVKVTAEKLHDKIKLVNRKRKAMQRVNKFKKLPNPPISGLDTLLIAQVSLNQDTYQFIEDTEALADELEQRVKAGISSYDGNGDGKRIMLAGSPSPMGNAKIHHIETAYSQEDIGQIRTRIEAFAEVLAEAY